MKHLSASAPLRLKKYPAYKDSGVYWIQNVPSHWESKRLKFAAKLINSKNEAYTDQLYVGLENIESWTGKFLEGESIPEGVSNLFEADDVLFGKLRPYLAKVLHAKNSGICTSEALVLRSNTLHPHYLFYYLLSRDFIGAVDSSTYGSKMPRASWDFIGNLPALNPSYSEQRSIASFLDRKTAEIDALIAKKRRMIELLQEKRTTVISHAVTKGLDPNAPMKDSGVEWLGKVPRHWEVKRLKYFVTNNDDVLPENTRPDYVIQYVDISSVTHANGIEKTEEYEFEKAPSRARRKVKDGDTIISTVRTYLKAIASIEAPPENLIVSTGFAVIRPRQGVIPKYLSYQLQSQGFVDAVVANSSGVSYPAINASQLITLPGAMPVEKEQLAIASFLDSKMAEIDSLITKIQNAIDKLLEYRTALISAAVTGKIDVRNEVRA